MTNIVNSLPKTPVYSLVNNGRSKFLLPGNNKPFACINIRKIENSNPSLPPAPSSNIKASGNYAQEISDIKFKNNTLERSDKLSEILRSSLDISSHRVSRSRNTPSYGNVHGLKSPLLVFNAEKKIHGLKSPFLVLAADKKTKPRSLVLEAIKLVIPHEKNAIESEFALVPNTELDKKTRMEEQINVVNQEINELKSDLLLVRRSFQRSESESSKIDNTLNILKDNLRNNYYKDKVMSLYISKHENSNIINQ